MLGIVLQVLVFLESFFELLYTLLYATSTGQAKFITTRTLRPSIWVSVGNQYYYLLPPFIHHLYHHARKLWLISLSCDGRILSQPIRHCSNNNNQDQGYTFQQLSQHINYLSKIWP